MQERVLFEADVDERGFEAVFEIAHFAFEDAADEAFFAGAFDGEFLELALFHDGDARFERFGVDDDFFLGRLACGLIKRWTCLMTLVAACLMLSTMPAGALSLSSTG